MPEVEKVLLKIAEEAETDLYSVQSTVKPLVGGFTSELETNTGWSMIYLDVTAAKHQAMLEACGHASARIFSMLMIASYENGLSALSAREIDALCLLLNIQPEAGQTKLVALFHFIGSLQ